MRISKQFILRCVLFAAASLAAHATPYYIYLAPNNGTPFAPQTGATDQGWALMTSWVFDSVTPIDGYAGQQMWGNTVRIHNGNATGVTISVLSGVWDSTGPDGGPGNRESLAATVPVTIPTGDTAIITYSNYTIPDGTFWMGYAFSNYGIPGTTADDLNALSFVESNGATVGADGPGMRFGTGAVLPGNNPLTGASQNYHLANSIQMWTDDAVAPEPASLAMLGGGLLAIGIIGRKRFSRQ